MTAVVKIFKYLRLSALCIFLAGYLLFGNGCMAALPLFAVVAVGGVAATVVTMVNLARDQYPDIDFEKPSPVETTYAERFNDVWNGTVDTLMEMKESVAMMDKNSGVIRTVKKNLNDVSWIGKGLGNATFMYEISMTVRQKGQKVSVELMVPFWEEKMFLASKEKNIPEGSNMMRHIFFRNLNKRLTPVAFRLPDSPMQDMRISPLGKEGQFQGQSPSTPAKQKPNPDVKQGQDNAPKDKGQPEKRVSLGKVKIKQTKVDVKNLPLKEADSLTTLKKGDEVEKLAEKSNWLEIRCLRNNSEIEGWINKYDCEGYGKKQKIKNKKLTPKQKISPL